MRKTPLPYWKRVAIGVALVVALALVSLGCGGMEARAAWEKGINCNAKGNSACALAELGKAVRLEPDNAQYRVSLAYALVASKMYEQAVSEFQAAIRIDPGNVEARRHLARLLR